MPPHLTPIATSHFQFTTPACPDQVWSALTRPDLTARFLFGMSVESDWRAGSSVVLQPPAGCGTDEIWAGEVLGEVLIVEEGRRLSFTLSSGSADPTTFVTWEIEALDDGARVTLYVDEIEPSADTDSAWLQAITALRSTLTRLLR